MDLISFNISVLHLTTKSPRPPSPLYSSIPNCPYLKVKTFYFYQDYYLPPLPACTYTHTNYGDLTCEFSPILSCKIYITCYFYKLFLFIILFQKFSENHHRPLNKSS